MPNFSSPGSPALLSVGELARRTGVATATLRSWETRHGFPRPARQGGGHRRYDEREAELVAEVVRLRHRGYSVSAAIEAATQQQTRPSNSFFATLRAEHPELRPYTLTKRTLGALTAAMEDEYCARASRPLLFGSFQRSFFYRQSETRWKELARTAEHSVVFADFEQLRQPSGRPVEAPLAADAPSRREWALVCDSPGYSACVTGWEVPSPGHVADADRRFETVWTLDAAAVRTASRVGISLLADTSPDLARAVATGLPDITTSPSADLQQATSLFSRILSYASDAGR